MFESVLIANRGEIAVRILRTCQRLGIRAIAVYSEADRDALHVRLADAAYAIGPAESARSYLDANAIVAAARRAGAEAIHPGYGFLSESEALIAACEDAGIAFVGPHREAIRAMGSKIAAKAIAVAAGVPVVPGYHEEDQSEEALMAAAERIGFPLLIKASAGGGGRGMRAVANIAEFLRYLRARGYSVAEFTMDGIRPSKTKSGDIRTLTDKPDADRLRPLFRLPMFTGCLNADEQEAPGDRVFHGANYFVPMLLAYLGPRRNEITGLAVKDVVETPNGWALDIRPNHLRRIKNAQSARMLPVPDEVLRLNFVPYVKAIRDLGYQALFPELFHPTRKNDPGDRFYKDFVPLIHASTEAGEDLELWERVLHALRHGQANVLKQSGVSIENIDDISGRLSKGETSTRYTNVAGLPLIRDVLSKYPSVTDHLESRPLQLLPWVARRQPPPWANVSKEERLAQARAVRSGQTKDKA